MCTTETINRHLKSTSSEQRCPFKGTAQITSCCTPFFPCVFSFGRDIGLLTWVLLSGRVVSSQDTYDGRLFHRLGCGSRWPTSLWPLEGPSSFLAHKLPRDEDGISSIETLSLVTRGLPCVDPHMQHYGSLLHKSSGQGCVRAPFSG